MADLSAFTYLASTERTKLNQQAWENIVAGESGTVTTPAGTVRKTLGQLEIDAEDRIANLAGFEPPVAYEADIEITTRAQTVSYEGVVYALKSTADAPYTTPETFDPTKWVGIIRPAIGSPQYSVATGETLKTLPDTLLTDGQVFETRDRLIEDLGGGATYEYRADSTATADDGNVIGHNSAPGRFHIMRRVETVDVREFKARLDGSDDSGAFAAAFSTGRHIFVPGYRSNIRIGTGTALPGLKSGQTLKTEDGPGFHTHITLEQAIRHGELNEYAIEGGIGPGFRLIGAANVPTIEQRLSRGFRIARGTSLVNCHTAIALGNVDADGFSYYLRNEADIVMRKPYLLIGTVTDGPFQDGEKVTQGDAEGLVLQVETGKLTLWQTNDENFTVGQNVVGETSGASAPILTEYRPGHMLHVLNHAGNLEYDCNGEGAYDGLSDGLHIDSNIYDRFDEFHIRDYLGRNRRNISNGDARGVNGHISADLEGALEYALYQATTAGSPKSAGQVGWGNIYLKNPKMSVLKAGGACVGIFGAREGVECEDIIGSYQIAEENRAHGLHIVRTAGLMNGINLRVRGTINPDTTGICGALIDSGGSSLRGLMVDVDISNQTATPLLAGVKLLGQPLGHIPRPRVNGPVTKPLDCDSDPVVGMDLRATSKGVPTDQLIMSPVWSAAAIATGAGDKSFTMEGGVPIWYPEMDYLVVSMQSQWTAPPPANSGDLTVKQNGVLVKGHTNAGVARHSLNYYGQGLTFVAKANQPVEVYFAANAGFTTAGLGARVQFKLIPMYSD